MYYFKDYLAYVLWGAIFDNRAVVAGFTFNTMISYYIIGSFIAQLDQSSGTGGQISREIRGGQFSKYMVRPMGVFGYFVSQTVGVSVFLLSFNLIAAVLWVFVFRVKFVISYNPFTLLSTLVICGLGLLFMMQLNFYIGILAFKFLDTGMFMMIKDNIMQFVTGSLIPLGLLPTLVQDIMRYFPFYYIIYLPSMLLMGENEGEITVGLVTLIIWNLAFWLLNKLTYKRLRTKYDGVGI
ncbi:ABC-2 family transporter protein [Alkalicella caledoniensis]|uniref:ABC-2 family transporter protein n=1 Tax=Alkalicella caledoniensis TaxID=2731377 RepID=A0A7G9WD76_ALKCA|nr:ABC-2 family transporter protein [Alkalicella caledoniensis]